MLVDDNQRVKKGDLLLQLDKEPFQVQVALKRAAVKVAEANLAAAESKARSLEAQLGSQRWKLQSACEQVDSQVALLAAQEANLRTQEATLDVARADYGRGQQLLPSSAISREDFDHRHQQYRVAMANVNQAREAIHQTRAALGLPPEPEKGKSLTDVPPDLNQTFSAVRTALADCMDTMTQLGLPLGFTGLTPNKALEEFRRFDKEGDIDRILRNLLPKVPSVLQANAALEQARHDLEQAELNLRYCDIVSEIDGVVTSRNVNPGNDVQFGQSLMAVRSVNGDLDRRQFQRDTACGPADRPAGAVRSGHVRRPQGVRGPHHRVHRWGLVRRSPCYRHRTPPATSSKSSSGCRSGSN